MARPVLQALAERHGRQATLAAARAALQHWREQNATSAAAGFEPAAFEARVSAQLEASAQPQLRPVFNLTGTVLHTNLGRAVAPPEAIDAVMRVMRQPVNLEFDLGRGERGDRDDHLNALLRELTGAEAATVVNNNAAAVLLVLSALAAGREVPVSRGELVEIGGAFRVPDIMRRSGARLVEVGTTNRTHLKDYAEALSPKTGLVMKVHASNYAIQGFTAAVDEGELAALCHQHGLPWVVDLGSGSLVDMTQWGLPAEPTPQQTLAHGADVVTFSGDKLLGGPQAGLIVGRKDLIAKIKKHPLKRALRLDKMTIAALEATLQLYRDPDRLTQRLPTLRMLTRPCADLQAMAEVLLPAAQHAFGDAVGVGIQACRSQIGSGSLPVDRLDSVALVAGADAAWVAACRSGDGRMAVEAAAAAGPVRSSGTRLARWMQTLRGLPVPVIGRVEGGRLVLDLRGLDGQEACAELAGMWQALPVGTLDRADG